MTAWGCGGSPQGVRDASPDEITIASEAISVGEYAAQYLAVEKQETESMSDKFTVKVSLKSTKDIPWDTVYILYTVKNKKGGATTTVTSNNLVTIKGPLAAGSSAEVSIDIPRDKPAGERSIVIWEISKFNPAG